MTCETCKNQCDCKSSEAFTRLPKFGDTKGSEYEPDTMTDSEIVKALECHSRPSNSCGSNCPYLMCEEVMCTKKLSKDALDLIKRQDAEIKKLRYNLEAVLDERADHSEAYKEFADRLKEKAKVNEWNGTICGNDIDNLLKEMVGEDNG